jgi:hypothetical protein
MISGKYEIDAENAEYLTSIYSRKHFEKPRFGFISALVQKFCGWSCCCDSDENNSVKIHEYEASELAAGKKDDEVLEKAIDGLLDRQLDMKYILQLIQDMELIKRVVFQERH